MLPQATVGFRTFLNRMAHLKQYVLRLRSGLLGVTRDAAGWLRIGQDPGLAGVWRQSRASHFWAGSARLVFFDQPWNEGAQGVPTVNPVSTIVNIGFGEF